MNLDLLRKYHPDLSSDTLEKFTHWHEVLRQTNQKVNLISRKDEDNIVEHHLLHALALKVESPWIEGTRFLDVGTGGGIPGVPLAILAPDCHFHLLDSTLKKIRAIESIVKELGLENVTCHHERIEGFKLRFHFILGRAVKPVPQMWRWTKKNLSNQRRHRKANALLYLGGIDQLPLVEAMQGIQFETQPLAQLYPDIPFYQEKILYRVTPLRS